MLCNKRSLHTTTKSSPRSPQLNEGHTQQRRPNAAKNKYINKFKKKNKTKTTSGSGLKLWLKIMLNVAALPKKKKIKSYLTPECQFQEFSTG